MPAFLGGPLAFSPGDLALTTAFLGRTQSFGARDLSLTTPLFRHAQPLGSRNLALTARLLGGAARFGAADLGLATAFLAGPGALLARIGEGVLGLVAGHAMVGEDMHRTAVGVAVGQHLVHTAALAPAHRLLVAGHDGHAVARAVVEADHFVAGHVVVIRAAGAGGCSLHQERRGDQHPDQNALAAHVVSPA